MGKENARQKWFFGILLIIGSVAYFNLHDQEQQVGGIAHLDGYYYYIYLRSLQMDGDIDFKNEYEKWGNPFEFGETATGKARNIFGVGPALLWSPFFLLSIALAKIGQAFDFVISNDGLSRFHQIITFYGSMLYGWLGLIFSFAFVKRLNGKSFALWAVLGAALAGPLPYYCLSGSSYSHAQATMAVSLMLWLWARWREDWTVRRWIAFGAATGLVLLVRPGSAPFLLVPLGEGIYRIYLQLRDASSGSENPAWKHALVGPLAAAGAALLVFSPQLIAWNILYGTVFTVPQGQGFFWWSESAWHSTLFSPRNGLFPSAPLMLLAAIGLLFYYRRAKATGALLIGSFVLLVALNGAVHDWWGWEFSARRYTSALPLFALGLAYVFKTGESWVRRQPTRAATLMVGGIVIVALAFNLMWMRLHSRHNLRWYQIRSSEGLYVSVTRGMLESVFDGVGNPLSLPASLAAKWRHGMSLRTFDHLSGSYLLGETNLATNPAGIAELHARMYLASPRFRFNLSQAFGPAEHEGSVGHMPLHSDRGHIYLPLNRPGALKLTLRVRAESPGTRVRFHFNDNPLNEMELPTSEFGDVVVKVPAKWVQRGINRLDLFHQVRVAPTARKTREIAKTPKTSPVDLSVASAGFGSGDFCQIWLGDQEVSPNQRGLNVALIDSKKGTLLDIAAFNVHLYPGEYDRLSAFISRQPKGTIVAVCSRGRIARYWPNPKLAGLWGGQINLKANPKKAYSAIGIVGAEPGDAVESLVSRGHARATVGQMPSRWRVVARYQRVILE
jgi:hypothetical protein